MQKPGLIETGINIKREDFPIYFNVLIPYPFECRQTIISYKTPFVIKPKTSVYLTQFQNKSQLSVEQ